MRLWARRSVAASIALATLAACSAGDTAAEPPPAVVVLRPVPDPDGHPFLDELRAQRLVPGRDLTVVPAGPEVTYPDVAAAEAALDELDRQPAVIVAYSTPYAELAAERFPDVPTVAVVNDPVASGLIEDRDRPERSLTGVTFATPADRTLGLIEQVLGGELDRLGYLTPVDDPAVLGPRQRVAEAAAAHGLDLVEVTFEGADAIPAAVDDLVAAEVDAVLLAASNAVIAAAEELERALEAAELPVVANNARFGFALAVLEPDGAEVRRQAARQVARLLAGDPVASVPVEDPRRFRVVLAPDRVAALGLPALEAGLLRQADEVR